MGDVVGFVLSVGVGEDVGVGVGVGEGLALFDIPVYTTYPAAEAKTIIITNDVAMNLLNI